MTSLKKNSEENLKEIHNQTFFLLRFYKEVNRHTDTQTHRHTNTHRHTQTNTDTHTHTHTQ